MTGARYDTPGAALGVRPGLLAGGGSLDTTSAIADAITPTTKFVSAVTPFADLAHRVVTADRAQCRRPRRIACPYQRG